MLFSSATFAAALLSVSSVLALPSLEERKSKFTFYDLKTPLAGPCDYATGPDGGLWAEAILANLIIRVDPKTGKVEEYPIPFTTPIINQTLPGLPSPIADRTALSCAIRAAYDGNLYASNGLRNQLVRINPNTRDLTIIQPPVNPAGNLFPFNDITPAEGGIYITQTTANIFQFYNFTDESFTTYDVPTPAAIPLGLKVAKNGNLYVAELVGNKILEFNPKTKEIQEYPMPLPLQGPAVVRAERGKYVYFSLFEGNGIGRINTRSKKIDVYPTSQLAGLGDVDTIDKDGGVWLGFFNVNVLARLDTNSFTYKYVPFPKTFAKGLGLGGVLGDVPPYADISVNYGPGNAIWFGAVQKNQIGRYSLD